ncbi:helix-turn-helix domain-containing protein [Bibersteinia trehalosi]|uniref:helix-turn-helix domain-containing protein n=1 Tax=Bibersteinia trehalosi TaxID=47735 RepID=UPI00056FA4E0|nr:helix-turn-helix transcriptional regulator [Bibersteinia trehalosi]
MINNAELELGYTPKNLKAIRQEHNLTQQQVADMTDTKSWRSVARWEAGVSETSHADMPLTKWLLLLKNLQKKSKNTCDMS